VVVVSGIEEWMGFSLTFLTSPYPCDREGSTGSSLTVIGSNKSGL